MLLCCFEHRNIELLVATEQSLAASFCPNRESEIKQDINILIELIKLGNKTKPVELPGGQYKLETHLYLIYTPVTTAGLKVKHFYSDLLC